MSQSFENRSSSPAQCYSSSPIPCATSRTSTPPSSPVLEPINSNDAFKKPNTGATDITDAFSLLGKRKAPLMTGDGNVRSQKRTALSRSVRSSAPALSQMQLSLGQKTEKRCNECGMLYVTCSTEDRKLHDVYHKRLTAGYVVGQQLASKATMMPVTAEGTLGPGDDERICVITSRDQPWKKKHAREVLDIITASLGAVEITENELWKGLDKKGTIESIGPFEMWLYLWGDVCAAAMLVERLRKKVRRVKASTRPDRASGQGESAIERLRRKREEAALDQAAPLQVSDAVHDAPIGISRIWTAPAFRKRGFAFRLLDTMYQQRWPGSKKRIESVAFSQPTAAGTRLARRWFGRQYGWLVY